MHNVSLFPSSPQNVMYPFHSDLQFSIQKPYTPLILISSSSTPSYIYPHPSLLLSLYKQYVPPPFNSSYTIFFLSTQKQCTPLKSIKINPSVIVPFSLMLSVFPWTIFVQHRNPKDFLILMLTIFYRFFHSLNLFV